VHPDLLDSGPVHHLAWTERPGRAFIGDAGRLLARVGAPAASGLDHLLSGGARRRLDRAVRAAAAHGGAVHVGALEVLRAEGDPAWLDVTLRVEGEAVDAIAVDVTEARADVADARDAMRAKSLFLATMSHEIRTPLNGILGLLQVLEDTELDADQRELLGLVTGSGEHLLSIVNDVLDLTKVEAGEVELELRRVDASAIARQVAGLFRHRATESGITIECDPITWGPQWVMADEHRLRQILTNLVSNAVKFTDEGEVRISAGVTEEGKSLHVEFAVLDTGRGIADPERIFEAFRQGDSSITRTHGGTGLGLSICRRLTELMGGTLTVESELGEGSLFRLRVPVEAAAAASAAGGGDGGAEADRGVQHLRVLVAEDNVVNQRVIGRFLTRLDVTHDLASDGVEAAELAAEGAHDVVLMDLHMPRLHGIDAALRIQEALGDRSPVIVPLTADVTVESAQRCAEAGMERIVAKPFRFEDLRSVLVEIAARRVSSAA